MHLLFSIFVSFLFFLGSQTIVVEFHKLNTKKEEVQFMNKYNEVTSPTIQAYVCAVKMKQAEYAFNPISKMKIFNTTKKKLEVLIKENPNNIDLRYVRLMLQERIPSFLGYNKAIENDKKFLTTKLKAKHISKDLEKYIYLNTSL